MTDNLPTLHSREVPNCREAENEDEAIAISEYHDTKVLAIGDQTKQEWIIAPASYSLEFMR